MGAPAARSLLLTVLGEYVLPRPQGVWQESLVGALVSLGYSQQAARQAVARSTRDGWLITERRGRRARMTLGERTAELLLRRIGEMWAQAARWPGPAGHPGYRAAMADGMVSQGPDAIRSRVRDWLTARLDAGGCVAQLAEPEDWSDWDERYRR